ncbi:hypothetical protein [Isoptericola variabilis]|uniref:Transcriptional regulator, AbiEi antitoxin, Type IV TA system n=1 Tax=Isoptericola variabilis (strain 225) TaxID=743718 RepID=F6FVF7_ISOV2|nr:hypothetical protein [Isoptericola variabilis]AEG44384.1 hypothetical protein Isova_1632 [Isoptericola variabilis 225]TWH34377.1 Transcriptional regulator, AbiEi antitoxin, Type IV TA system [Isoptericola variabilis J7]
METNHPPGRPGGDVPQGRTLPQVIRSSRDREAEVGARHRRGKLRKIRHGIYVESAGQLPAASVAVRREREHLVNLAATLSSLRTDLWVSHTSAALLWGCWTYRLGATAEITQLHPPDVRASAGPVRRHWTDLPERDRTLLGDVPVTTLERTVVDCARSLPGDQAIVVVESALRIGCDGALVAAILKESTGRRGVRSARRVLDVADGRVESPGEARLRWMLLSAGLPYPDAAIPVETWAGERWVDLGWPDLQVGFEFDGRLKYAGLPPAQLEQVLYEEKRRHDALVEAGWILIRVSWADLDDPEALLRRVDAARRRARARLRGAR